MTELTTYHGHALSGQSRALGATTGVSLASLAFFGLFACMPLSGVWPIWVVKCFPAIIFAVLLIISTPNQARPAIRRWGFLPFFVGMAVLATASLIANGINEYSLASYLGCYPAALVVYLAIRFRRTNCQEFDYAMVVYSIVAMVPLVMGIHAFYTSYGIPDLNILMVARFDEALEPYRQVTWGNVTNTASFLMAVIPLFIVFTLDVSVKLANRCWFGFCSLVCLINLLLINTRSAFIVFTAIFLMAMFFCRQGGSKVFLIALLIPVGMGLQILNSGDGKFWEYMQGATHVHSNDGSVVERIESIAEGWKVLGENPILGVGPGNSIERISQTAVHQMALQQGVEYGILGLVGNLAIVGLVLWKTLAALVRRSINALGRQSFACLLSACSYLTMGTIANACTNTTTMNPWIVTFAAMLAMTDAREGNGSTTIVRSSKPQLCSVRRPTLIPR